ncbi:hypothetical protein MDAP_002842 [Mitosporidium daphniae]
MPMNGGKKGTTFEDFSLSQEEAFSRENGHMKTLLPSSTNNNRNAPYHHFPHLQQTPHHSGYTALQHPHISQQMGQHRYPNPPVHSPQQHQLIPGFVPPNTSPPCNGGGFYLENEKISTSSDYPSPTHQVGVRYPEATHGASQMQPQMTLSNYREGYPSSFVYRNPQPPPPPPESVHQAPESLFRSMHMPPHISPNQHMFMITKRDEITASVSMKLKKKRESHNAVERRRRDNINERIQFLSSIVPECKRRQERSSIVTGMDSKRSQILVPNMKLNKSFILQKATEYIEAMTMYIERQSVLLKEVIPSYVGGIEELNASVVEEGNNFIFSLENLPSDFQGLQEEEEEEEESKQEATQRRAPEEAILQKKLQAEFRDQT